MKKIYKIILREAELIIRGGRGHGHPIKVKDVVPYGKSNYELDYDPHGEDIEISDSKVKISRAFKKLWIKII